MNNFLTRLAGQAIGISTPVVKPDLPPQIPVVNKNVSEETAPQEDNHSSPEQVLLKQTDRKIPPQVNEQPAQLANHVKHNKTVATATSRSLSSSATDKNQKKQSAATIIEKPIQPQQKVNVNKTSLEEITIQKPITSATPIKRATKENKTSVDPIKKRPNDNLSNEVTAINLPANNKPILQTNIEKKTIIKNIIANDIDALVKQPNNQTTVKEKMIDPIIESPIIPVNQPKIINKSTTTQRLNTLKDRQQNEVQEMTSENSTPNIRINIGKVEVRTKAPQPIAKPVTQARSAKVSLQDYLKQRNDGAS